MPPVSSFANANDLAHALGNTDNSTSEAGDLIWTGSPDPVFAE
jgi:hypothetical protein